MRTLGAHWAHTWGHTWGHTGGHTGRLGGAWGAHARRTLGAQGAATLGSRDPAGSRQGLADRQMGSGVSRRPLRRRGAPAVSAAGMNLAAAHRAASGTSASCVGVREVSRPALLNGRAGDCLRPRTYPDAGARRTARRPERHAASHEGGQQQEQRQRRQDAPECRLRVRGDPRRVMRVAPQPHHAHEPDKRQRHVERAE